VTIKGCAVT